MHCKVAIVDDHQLFAKSLEMMINSFESCNVVMEVHSGEELQRTIAQLGVLPDVMLLDVSMPEMSGVAVAHWMNTHYPTVKLAALTINDEDNSIVAMLKAGCCSYLLKNIHPVALEKALHEITEKGYYSTDASNINYRRLLTADNGTVAVTERERQFLMLAAGDDTYKQIAQKMEVSPSTVDGYRNNVFKKLNVSSRTAMVLEAMRRGWIEMK